MPVAELKAKLKRVQRAKQAAARSSLARSRVFTGRRFNVPAVASARSSRYEVKTLDFPTGASTTTQTISTTATLDCLNLVLEGASFYNRVGRKVMMRSVHITGELQKTGNGAGVPEYSRIMLVYDRQPNGAFPAIADILACVDNAGASTTDAFSKMNMNNVERFMMLRDHRIQVPYNGVGAAANDIMGILNYDTQANINWFVKLNNMEVHYKATAGNIADISTGAIYLVTFGNIASATAGYKLIYNSRLRYKDL